MTALGAILELLARMEATSGAAIFVSQEELGHWPVAAVKALKSQKLLVKTRPAASVVCPGCEQECVMPVHSLPAGPCGPASFIVCDKRCDINRVPVAIERLTQWRCDTDALCRFVAESLGLRRCRDRAANGGILEIGIATGDKRKQMLCLKVDGELALVAGNSALPFSESIDYRNGKYRLDQAVIRHLVDSVTTADNRYTPTSARREARKLATQTLYYSWQKDYRSLTKRHPNMSDVWYSRQIAKLSIAKGRSAGTIKKHMKS
ncbi:MAG TPA: hypothetical protein VEH30_13805 [Terriglobales bacterium]|nr:hypothetical protein [Terriglobales bacterium]